MTDNQRITRQTRPTASFSIDLSQLVWIKTVAEQNNVSASAILRVVLDAAMNDPRFGEQPNK